MAIDMEARGFSEGFPDSYGKSRGKHEGNSLRETLIKLLKSESKVFTLREIYARIESFYQVLDSQKELDSKYPYPVIEHEIKSQLNILKSAGVVSSPRRAGWCFNP
ncbi:hypothetical protein HYV85_06420 [Candidatus Woesearchaeota archaeon]|nr:hypothetical protein [Candidatus Woesearchaeota archaeon]